MKFGIEIELVYSSRKKASEIVNDYFNNQGISSTVYHDGGSYLVYSCNNHLGK